MIQDVNTASDVVGMRAEDFTVMLSDQSIIVARERYADLLREADRERQLTAAQQLPSRHSSFVARGPSLWRQRVDRLRAVAGERRSTLAPCAE